MAFIGNILSNRKILKILVVIVIIIAISCFLWMKFHYLLDEGKPRISFTEVNETRANSGYISHLSDQEYQEFPRLKEIIEPQKTNPIWFNGYSDPSDINMISEQEKDFIYYKYTKNNEIYNNFLEYKGKYYYFVITTP